MSGYKGFIFDFNGVLFWDDHIQRKSWRHFASQLRDKPLTDDEIDLHIHGRNGQYTIEYLTGNPINQAEAEDLTEQKEIIYREMCLAGGACFKLSPGAIVLLNDLVDHQIPHTIATASGMKNVHFFVEHLRLDAWFDIQKVVYNNGCIPGKPAPDLYLQAAKNLGLRPDQCVVVENSRSGIQAAYHAGIGYIIALGPQSSHEDLVKHQGVCEVIDHLGRINVQDLFLTKNEK